MIAVMGATGNTGRKIAEQLLAAGEPVRVLGRSEEKLAPLARAGAELFLGDAADPQFLADAFRGADAVYALLPTDRRAPDYLAEQRRQGEAIISALHQTGVPHLVFLSSLGADLPAGTGVIAGLHAQEERFKQLPGVNILLLRPVSFFENVYDMLPLIKAEGIMGDVVQPDLPLPMVATQDIADVATQALLQRDWTGTVVRELLGPRDLSQHEIATILGQRIGCDDLAYVQFSAEDMTGALIGAGLSESFAQLYVEMAQSFNKGIVQPRDGRTAGNTTPTRFEDFAAELAAAYHAM